MDSPISSALKLKIVSGWFEAQDHLTQGAYLAQVQRDLGVVVAPRTLRAWLGRLDTGSTARTSVHIREAFRALRKAEESLRALIGETALDDAAPEADVAADDAPDEVAAAEHAALDVDAIVAEVAADNASSEAAREPATLPFVVDQRGNMSGSCARASTKFEWSDE